MSTSHLPLALTRPHVSPPPESHGTPGRHGLDPGAEVERPWSSAATDALALPSAGQQRAGEGSASKPTVTVRYVVVDGPDGFALQQRQAAAIRQALAWLAAHPGPGDRTETQETCPSE